MDAFVFTAVLFAAACHAGWNALIKTGLNPLSSTTLITTGCGVVALAALPFTGLPSWESGPWAVASIIVRLIYFATLIESYRTGDLGQVYPIARGSAPLMTAGASILFVGEHVSLLEWAGILVLVGGVFLLSAKGGRDLAKFDKRAIGFALFTALMVCAYSIVDGIGGRASGNAAGYSAVLFVGNALVMLPYALWRESKDELRAVAHKWVRGLVGGAMQLLSYTIAIWAMTVAPIAIVAALRETSVLFGAALSVIVLKEPLRAIRVAAAALIVCGLVMIRLS